MTQFFFDMMSGGKTTSDNQGLPFASADDACAHAMSLLPVMDVGLPMISGEFRTWTVTVREHADAVVCRLIMAIINDDLSPGAQRVLMRRPRSE